MWSFHAGLSGGFLSGIILDFARGTLKANEVKRAIEIRNIVTSLGPAYIKLGQALSIRPDILSPAAMNELQKLCDKVCTPRVDFLLCWPFHVILALSPLSSHSSVSLSCLIWTSGALYLPARLDSIFGLWYSSSIPLPDSCL